MHGEWSTPSMGTVGGRKWLCGLGGRELVPDEARAIFAGEAPTHIALRS